MNSNTEQENTERPAKGRSLWSDGIRRLRKRTFAMICFGIVLFYFVLAGTIYLDGWFGGYLKAFQWNQIVGPSYQPPMTSYEWTPEGETAVRTDKTLFGTDFLGQSTLRKTIYGAKTSITVAMCASIISLLIGVPLGAIAGYFRGWVDDAIVWLFTTLNTIPYILLVMAFAVVLRDKTIFGWEIRGITAVYLAIGLTSWVGICRLIRGEIIKRKENEYVLAAQALGCSNRRIIFKHLLPNVFHVIIINFSLQFVSFIHAEVILSFLGLGETDKPSWGAMIDAARTELARNVWWEMAAATLAIFFISLALNIFGDALRDCLDPKLRTD
jgi:peptide/nickel transport system permease protein